MSTLAKATLQEITADAKADPKGDPIEVQFNPNSLKLQISNSTEGNQSRGRQARQFIGKSSTTLSMDLIFDTADEGTTDTPRSVRERTALVEQFVLPKATGKTKEAPPKLRFFWGGLQIDGLLESITIDFDHFAPDGTPLRAKVGISIKEQDSKYEFLKAQPPDKAPQPGQASPGAPGGSGGPASQSAPALGGESAAEFAARQGLDPAAWRGLSLGASFGASLSLEAGAEIGFDAELGLSAGLGLTVGIEAGASVSLEASFGLEAGAGFDAVAGVGFGANLSAGFALTAAGGVGAAIASVATARATAAAQETRTAFGAPPPASPPPTARAQTATTSTARAPAATATAPKPSPPDQRRPPLAATGLPTPAAQEQAPPAPPPPRADARATSFGFGVPLRTQVQGAADLRTGTVGGRIALRTAATTATGDPPFTDDPTVPPWIQLPASERARDLAGRAPLRSRPRKRCGCSGPCHHRGV
jgi:hypothetical protein